MVGMMLRGKKTTNSCPATIRSENEMQHGDREKEGVGGLSAKEVSP